MVADNFKEKMFPWSKSYLVRIIIAIIDGTRPIRSGHLGFSKERLVMMNSVE